MYKEENIKVIESLYNDSNRRFFLNHIKEQWIAHIYPKTKQITAYYIVDELFHKEEVSGRYDIQHLLEGYRIFADKDYNIEIVENLNEYYIEMEILLNTVFITGKDFIKKLDNSLAKFLLEDD